MNIEKHLKNLFSNVLANLISNWISYIGLLFLGVLGFTISEWSFIQWLYAALFFVISFALSIISWFLFRNSGISKNKKTNFVVHTVFISTVLFIGMFFQCQLWNRLFNGSLKTFQEEKGIVVIEAENFTGKIPGSGKGANTAWKDVENDFASNKKGVQAISEVEIDVNTNRSTSGAAVYYKIKFSEIGQYTVYMRGYAPDGGKHDSIHAGLLGEEAVTNQITNDGYGIGMGFSSKEFDWVKVYNKSETGKIGLSSINIPEPGFYLFTVWIRENGAILDRIVLSKDAEMLPVNLDKLPETVYLP